MAKVRSYSALMKSAQCVQIGLNGADVSFTPMKNEGPREGYSYLVGKTLHHSVGAEDLGTKLLEAFVLCE